MDEIMRIADIPITEAIAERLIRLPLWVWMTTEEVQFVTTVRKVVIR